LTQDQVEQSPGVDLAKPVSRQQIEQLNTYYGWPATWTDAPLLGTSYIAPHPVVQVNEPGPEPIETDLADRHLRSAREVIGYRVLAKDGEIGQVEDVLVDETDWTIRYILVDTRSWLPVRKVLVEYGWIERVGWTDEIVRTNLSQRRQAQSRVRS
jgi:sporulation protein YlmC with PRC-barrel domain